VSADPRGLLNAPLREYVSWVAAISSGAGMALRRSILGARGIGKPSRRETGK
jgi:hypothetical protein